VLPNALGRTVHFTGNGKGKGSCCGVVFMTFLKFFLKCREWNPCREAASNVGNPFRCITSCYLSSTPIMHSHREVSNYYFLYKKKCII
jgi:hypothetical protein